MVQPNKGDVDHVQLLVAIARLEGKVDAMCGRMDDHLTNDTLVHVDHEKRIRVNEQSRIRIQALAAVVAASVSAAVTWLMKTGGINGS